MHVLYAHPVETSFSAAIHKKVCETLLAVGHEVDDLDLYQGGFVPVMSRQDRLDYHDTAINQPPLQNYVDRLLAAEALVVCHPVWNYGWPAILKGYFDRVWMPGVAFKLDDDGLKPNLQHLKAVATITSYGGNRWRSWLMGDPPRKIGKRYFRALTENRARIHYLALYGIDQSTAQQRSNFLNKVEQQMRDL